MDGFQIQGTTFNDRLLVQIDGANIVQSDMSGNKRQIGVTLQTYKDLENTTQSYYDKLVELGVIVPPKTQEELLKETQEALSASQKTTAEMLQMMKDMKQEMEELKIGRDENSGAVIKDVPERRHKSSGSASAKDDTGCK